MVQDTILVVFLVLSGLVYVFYMKKVKQPGTTHADGRLAKWLSGWMERSPQTVTAHPPQWAEVQDEIVAALDDIYQEFITETAALRQHTEDEMKALREEFSREIRAEVRKEVIVELRKQLQQIALKASEAPGSATEEAEKDAAISVQTDDASLQTSGPDTEVLDSYADSKHFVILDALYQGKGPDEIASELKISVDEVKHIQKLLENPNAQEGSKQSSTKE